MIAFYANKLEVKKVAEEMGILHILNEAIHKSFGYTSEAEINDLIHSVNDLFFYPNFLQQLDGCGFEYMELHPEYTFMEVTPENFLEIIRTGKLYPYIKGLLPSVVTGSDSRFKPSVSIIVDDTVTFVFPCGDERLGEFPAYNRGGLSYGIQSRGYHCIIGFISVGISHRPHLAVSCKRKDGICLVHGIIDMKADGKRHLYLGKV